MYAADVDYYRAGSLEEAHRLLASHPGAKLLAGGQSLVPLLKLRLAAPPALVDIGRVPQLRGITRANGRLRIGALTTHGEIAVSDDVRAVACALAEAAGHVGDPAVRNRGTIGGNIAHADPASDLPTVLVALDARVLLSGPKDERAVPADEFFTGIMTTAMADDEILTAVEVPEAGEGAGSAYEKFPHPASRYAVIGAAAVLALKDGTCQSARLAIGGLLPSPRRAMAVERALSGKPMNDDTMAEAARQVTADLGSDVMGDLFASAEYRAATAHVYVRRAIAAAVNRTRR